MATACFGPELGVGRKRNAKRRRGMNVCRDKWSLTEKRWGLSMYMTNSLVHVLIT